MTTTMMPIMNFLMIIHMLMSCPRKSLVKITNRTLLICMLLANLDILMIFHMQSMKVFWRLFYLKDHMLRNGSTVVFLISFRYLADLFLVRFRFSNRKRTIERSYQQIILKLWHQMALLEKSMQMIYQEKMKLLSCGRKNTVIRLGQH